MNKLQANSLVVLDRLKKQVGEDSDDAKILAGALEIMLNELHENDFFGTEGQSDPRGDFRNGKWSMKKIEVSNGNKSTVL